jgi:hypothetical protein
METTPNKETVNDLAKLIMHRLIARALARNPSLVGRAGHVHAQAAERFPNQSFIREWNELLGRPLPELRLQLTSRSPGMKRLRLSSPFGLVDELDFTDPTVRRRIWSAAKRLATRETRPGRKPPVDFSSMEN